MFKKAWCRKLKESGTKRSKRREIVVAVKTLRAALKEEKEYTQYTT